MIRPNSTVGRLLSGSLLVVAALAGGTGCASNAKSDVDGQDAIDLNRPGVTTSSEDGMIVKRYDLDGNETPDVVKHFEEYQDPENDGVTLRRLRKKEVDVNGDGEIDIIKEYDKKGVPLKEKLDMDLNGTFDVVSHFTAGKLVRKELFGEKGKKVHTTRTYADGKLKQVKKDTDGDGSIDYWEFYEQGVLQRIGRDVDGDEKPDKWVNR